MREEERKKNEKKILPKIVATLFACNTQSDIDEIPQNPQLSQILYHFHPQINILGIIPTLKLGCKASILNIDLLINQNHNNNKTNLQHKFLICESKCTYYGTGILKIHSGSVPVSGRIIQFRLYPMYERGNNLYLNIFSVTALIRLSKLTDS